jgi:hypothetical protein
MKTLFLKNVVPAAVIALGISGAFATMSMQTTAKASAPKIGYVSNAQGPCNISVQCDDTGTKVCRLNGATGPQAFGMDDDDNCTEVLFQPRN